MGGKELLTVRCRPQRDRDERKIKWRIFPDRLRSCLHFIYAQINCVFKKLIV